MQDIPSKYLEELKRSFQVENENNPEEHPFCWKKEPSFIFWNSDYKTYYVMNINYLFGQGGNLFQYLTLYMALFRKAVQIAKIPTRILPIMNNQFNLEMHNLLTDTGILPFFADFFHISEEIAYYCLANSASSFLVKAGINAAQWLVSYVTSSPYALIYSILSGASISEGTSYKFDLEVQLNIANALTDLFMCFQQNPDTILDCNALLIAIDERNFSRTNIFSSFRRNDSSICKFVYIEELSGAPKARDINSGNHPISYYIDIFQAGSRDEMNLDELIRALR